jgi:CRISPR type I-E-associated protein CasB/Cse2
MITEDQIELTTREKEEKVDHDLIRHLIRLHDAHDETNNDNARGKLANLRYAMRDQLHAEYPVGRVFPALALIKKTGNAEYLSDDAERNEWRTLIAGLFGFAYDNIEHTRGVSLGYALRTLYEARENDSLERRFMSLLNADAEHLPGHLRQSISLLKAESIGLDWEMLLHDVCSWNAPGKYIQKKWIQHYYRSRKEDKPAPAMPAANSEDTNDQF